MIRKRKVLSKISNELEFIGGFGNKWIEKGKKSRNYKQGYRVYSSNGVACAITSQGGGLGSYTGLYLIEQPKQEKEVGIEVTDENDK